MELGSQAVTTAEVTCYSIGLDRYLFYLLDPYIPFVSSGIFLFIKFIISMPLPTSFSFLLDFVFSVDTLLFATILDLLLPRLMTISADRIVFPGALPCSLLLSLNFAFSQRLPSISIITTTFWICTYL